MAQWLEHSTESQRVVVSNPIWGSDFFEPTFLLEYLVGKIIVCVFSWQVFSSEVIFL